MNEIIIYSIFGFFIGIAIAAVVYFYFVKDKLNSNNNSTILLENADLKGQIDGFKKNEKTLTDSLQAERKTTAEQLKTINKIDEHKTSISNYRTTTEERNRLD